jgi:BirA family transcriptional regulator, biotin operon repressor / biotin---[acetyl-CoA-carboxylase] ligase
LLDFFHYKSTAIPLEINEKYRIIGQIKVSFDQLDSTNEFAVRWIAKSKPIEGTVITAGFQRKGKGQIGRTWWSSPGNNLAYSTILYPKKLNTDHTQLCNMALSTGVVNAIKPYLSGNNVKLKWPNDIYVDDRKLGGILIQTALSGDKLSYLIFGLGLNVNESTFDSSLPNPISLYQLLGRKLPMSDITNSISESLTNSYDLILSNDWTRIRQEYLNLMYGIGEKRSFASRMTGMDFDATVLGVTENGKLLLNQDGKVKPFNFHELQWK